MAATATTQWILELVDKITGPMKSIGQTADKVKSGVDGIGEKFKKFGESNKALLSEVTGRVPMLGEAISLMTNPYALATAAAVAFGAATYKSVDMAMDWREGLAKINVTAQLTQDQLSKLSDQLLVIGERNVAPIEQIPDAFNRIISAGLDVATSMRVLEPTLQAAKAGFTDVETTAKAAVNVMNSSGRDITEVYDVLFATVNKGNAEFADIANYLPKIIPVARNAGLALGETAGAWAYLTAQGQSSERATTLTENALKAIADPARIKAFKSMGIALYDSQGKIKPLINIIDQLKIKTSGLSDLSRAKFFGNLGLDMEAASFFSAATQDAQKLRETIDFVTNSQGQLAEAYRNSMTPMDHFHVLQNLIKGKMIEFGTLALPIINNVGEWLLKMVDYFKNLWRESALFRDIISGLGYYFGFLLKMAWAPLVMVWNLLKNLWSIAGSLVDRFTGMSGGIEGFYKRVRPYLYWVKSLLEQIARIGYNIMTFNFKGAVEAVRSFKMPDMEVIRKNLKADDAKQKEDPLKLGGSPKLKTTDLVTSNSVKDKTKSMGGSGSGGGIKTVNQKIEIKNYFTVSNGTDVQSIAEQVVRAINDRLRDGVVAAID